MRMGASEKRRLENLGFVIGQKLTPLLDRGGVMLVALGSSRVALNKSVAQKILVK
ncbi:MAG: ferrous iron transport protein A [Opitutales bacterium]|nr:ferrous iron transport protein A [Opitutales bacterium]